MNTWLADNARDFKQQEVRKILDGLKKGSEIDRS